MTFPNSRPSFGNQFYQFAFLHAGKSVYHFDEIDIIMNDIYTKGPVTAMFKVYSDFVHYKSGKLSNIIAL